jgi:RNA polymerase sigma factor (sigma-70 family)
VRNALGTALDHAGLVRVPHATDRRGDADRQAAAYAARRLLSTELVLARDGPTIGDTLASEPLDVGAAMDRGRATRRVQRALARLPERDRRIIARRMDGESLAEIGDDYGLSRERIRRLQAKAFAVVRERLGVKEAV